MPSNFALNVGGGGAPVEVKITIGENILLLGGLAIAAFLAAKFVK